ncbi:uncharacterized protein LOC115989568 [Quercus lobata]|uniref:C2H2-type domain-containing protein n=1 Tax=Quercus lobata TaxID=97700 RepID=A0A7N2LNS0_QUELO|nr:uncharacterized protein LOC115989568 [Quercus lobata]
MSSMKRNATPSPSQPPPSDVDDQSPNITEEVDHAMNEFYNGNPTKALSLVKDILSRHPNSALAHNTLSYLLDKSLDSTATPDHKKLKNAKSSVNSSKRAVELCPISLSFWYSYVIALVKLAYNDNNAGFEAVIQACDTSLSIENPIVHGEDEIDLIRKNLRLFKLRSVYLIDTKYLGSITNEIQELQDRKEEIELRAVSARKNFKTQELASSDNKRKLKNVKKVAADVDTVATRVKAYWNHGMSMDQKKDLLRIGIEDLKLHFAKNNSPAAMAVFMQAVEYVKVAKNWKFWTCCCCSERFFDVELNREHIKSVHLGTFSDESQSVMPEIEFDSVHDTVESRKWGPVDVIAAKKMMEDLSRNRRGDEGLNESTVFMNQKEWPYCKDSRRDKVINEIRARLRLFLRVRFFVSSHLLVFMDLIMEMLKKRIPEQLLKEHWMNRTLLSACFLDISELNRVLKFLDDLAHICGLYGLCSSLAKDKIRGEFRVAYHEKIVFNEDFSCVVFDKRMLHGELLVPNDGAAVTSSANAEIVLNDDECKDAIMDWLLKGGTNINIGEQLKQWANLRETSRSQGKDFFKIYEAEFHRMQNILEKKILYLRYIKVFQNLDSICVEEDKRREEFGRKPLSYESLLSERERQTKNTYDGNFESDIIWYILEENHEDNEIKLEIKRHISEINEKLYKFDGIIRTTTIAMQQTGKKIEAVTAYDYRSIMVPLLKSFILERLDELAKKDAEEKSKAAAKALLSEPDLDDKKNTTDKGCGDARQGKGKSKEKMKKKNKRKPKELQATGGSKEHQENVEQISFPAEHGGDNPPNPEIFGPVITDELGQDKPKLMPEEEKEQRTLEEHLEDQRHVENEAKQERLAELNKAGSSAGNMEKKCLRRINFDDFNWKYFYQAQGVKLDEK